MAKELAFNVIKKTKSLPIVFLLNNDYGTNKLREELDFEIINLRSF